MPIEDDFRHQKKGLDSPYVKGVDVTPSDSTLLPFVTRALMCATGGAGAIAVEWEDGTSSTLSIVAGSPLKVRVQKVLATGTTATGIVALR